MPPTPRAAPAGPIGVAILGSTGSIGRQTLAVIDDHPDRFRVVALTAGTNVDLLQRQAARYLPELVAIDSANAAGLAGFDSVLLGVDGLLAAATLPAADIVVVATAGHAAILPTYHAISHGKTIALANKETIVCAGELIVPFARKRGVEIRPIDSEHSAIWQSLGTASSRDIRRLTLTASGGPFRKTPLSALASVSVAQALAHPTWSMGGKVTIDSASLMNKGLEVIEAHWLFDVPYPAIDVLIHPESIIHSLVEFADRSQIAQLSLPDMRLPIQYALTYPQHAPSQCRSLNLAEIGALHFASPDTNRFPSLALARQAGEAGQTFPTVLSAADEVAVSAFIAGRLRFIDIAHVVEETLARHQPESPLSFDTISIADKWAHITASMIVERRVVGRPSPSHP